MSRGAIAVAVDGSAASEAALRRAVGLARADGRPLAGVFVLDTGWSDFIGSDWQSAADSRQGFLDYIRAQLEEQAEFARRQFAAATATLDDAHFEVIPGDPLEALCAVVKDGHAETLVAGREVFRVCGRPSVRRLARDLARRLPGVQIV